jgi:hypothetical protein
MQILFFLGLEKGVKEARILKMDKGIRKQDKL